MHCGQAGSDPRTFVRVHGPLGPAGQAHSPCKCLFWPVSGRVTVAEGTGALYRRGVWLESGDGRILDLNRADAADGVRVAKAQRSLISEYRAESTLSVRKTSVLLDIWRGTAPGYADFASQDDMQRAYARMKRNVADIMVLGSVRAAS